MGYTTYFTGEFSIMPALTAEHRAYLAQFAEIRHMKRDVAKLAALPDPLREAVGLPLGVEGEFYVGTADTITSQDQDGTVLDINREPSTQPDLWCQWRPSDDGSAIVWDEGEKFYAYVEWLNYLVSNFLTPWGYSLAGEVYWSGEDDNDRGRIVIKSPSNEVIAQAAIIAFPPLP